MCIFVDQWYVCQHDPELNPLSEDQLNPPRPADPDNPWKSWKHGDALGPRVPGKSFMPVRHKQEYIIRCGLVYASLCESAPRTVHTESFLTVCPSCSGLDPSVRDTPPSVSWVTKPNVEGWSALERERFFHVAEWYFKQTDSLVRVLFSRFVGTPIPTDPSQAFAGAQFCTEDAEHVGWSRHAYPFPSTCACPNNRQPWAHNIARALHRHEGRAMWATVDPQGTNVVLSRVHQTGYTHVYRRMSRSSRTQLSLAMGEPWWESRPGYSARIAMVDQINKQASATLTAAKQRFGSDPDFNEMTWQREMDIRQLIATQWAYYPAVDSGLSHLFRECLLRSFILPTLRLDVESGRLPNKCSCDTLDLSLTQIIAPLHQVWDTKLGDITQAGARRSLVHIAMMRNAQLARRNAREAFGSMLFSHVNPAKISFAQGLELASVCAHCQDDLRLYGPGDNVPNHFKLAALPCCGKPMHIGCLMKYLRKSEYTGQRKCPMCRAEFRDYGWIHMAHHDFHDYEKLPAGWLNYDAEAFQVQSPLWERAGDVRHELDEYEGYIARRIAFFLHQQNLVDRAD